MVDHKAQYKKRLCKQARKLIEKDEQGLYLTPEERSFIEGYRYLDIRKARKVKRKANVTV